MSGKVSVRGPGRFQWSAGGWWGGQLGASGWMAALAGIYLAQGRAEAALAMFACFLAANSVGAALWTNRHRLAPFPALQGLLAGLFLTSAAALLVSLAAAGAEAASPVVLHLPTLSPLGVYPGLMFFFWLLERESRRARRVRK
ncbi:MAG: hypothetical protein AB1916_13590 [Thermodesulfobacteriota bacterium]